MMRIDTIRFEVKAESKRDTSTAVLAQALAEPTPTDTPLAVDLDGTLIHTDMLWESFIALLKQNAFSIFLVPVWLGKGKAYLKHEIARRVTLDVSALPYNDEFVTFLREQRRAGRKLILITGCAKVFAQRIADHLGIFSDVIASTTKTNMTGKRKVKALQEKYGNRGFEYAGNEKADLPVWADSCGAIVVNAPERLVLKVKQVTRLNRSFQARRRDLAAFIRVMLPKHR